MNKRKIFASLIIFVLLFLSGCSGYQEVATISPDFDKVQDLSLYIIEEQPKASAEPVALDPNLEYVDTSYITKKLNAVAVTSSRKTYEEAPSEWDFVLIDARPKGVFNAGHLNGSINIPDAEFAQLKHLLPTDLNKELIFYCGGLACPLSAKSAKKAIELGYTNVKVYQEGTPAWSAAGNYMVVTDDYVKGLILESYVTRVDYPTFLIIDTRPYSLYFEAHIPNAIQMDDTIFGEKYLNSMPEDKATEIVLYCGGFTCGKSHNVANQLVDNGYTNIKVFAGGLPVWKAQKLPTFGIAASDGGFNVAEGKVNRGLTPAQFTEKVNSGAVVIDVRTADERSHGAIPGSLHIPDSVIHADPKAIAGQLPADKNATIVIHCASGARASGVVDKIADLGYKNTFYLNNAINVSADGSYSF